ncbi:MAG TPA: DHH family phosphoesterase, partial [Porphyromonadaceae bacterium]|nr:DHH family phosphoesterase [Porphyromonadaceae bacterium]
MLTPVIAERLVSKAKELLESNSSIVLLTHAHPDGDAIGSSLALKNLLEHWGKKASIVIIDKAPESFDFLKGFKDILVVPQIGKEKTKQIFDEASLICCLDFNESGRVGKYLQELLTSSQAKRLIIDHHLDINIVGEVTISCPELSSTSEIIFRLVWQMGVYPQMDRDFAEDIYCGIVCDTGNFSYGSNSPELFYIV